MLQQLHTRTLSLLLLVGLFAAEVPTLSVANTIEVNEERTADREELVSVRHEPIVKKTEVPTQAAPIRINSFQHSDRPLAVVTALTAVKKYLLHCTFQI